jgi:hypothetical protein
MDLETHEGQIPTEIGARPPRLALLWRGDPTLSPPAPEDTRLASIFAALAARGVVAEPVIYADEIAHAARERLLGFDGVMVWVDPISVDEGKDRSVLDPILCQLAARGVWVSTHPDIIMKMGVKEVLHRTQALGWGVDTDLYSSAGDFFERFPARLAASGPRVLKQNRGNGGQGVWKVEVVEQGADRQADATLVRVLEARRGSAEETLPLGEFMARCRRYFANAGRMIDQAFQPRLPDGMIRCYMSQGDVAGFGHQLIKALIAPPPPGSDPSLAEPGPRIMHPPDAPPFQALRARVEAEWAPAMSELMEIDADDLPALWDADFLYGPKTADGDDTYVLCEINVSAITPYPESAAPIVAEAALRQLRARRGVRQLAGEISRIDRP